MKRHKLPKLEIKLLEEIKEEIRSHLVGGDPASIESFIDDFEYLYEGMQRTTNYRKEITKTVANQLKRDLIKKLKKIEKDIEELTHDDLKIKGSRYHGPTKIKYLLGVDCRWLKLILQKVRSASWLKDPGYLRRCLKAIRVIIVVSILEIF